MQSPLYWHTFLIGPLLLAVHILWGIGQAVRTITLGLSSEDDGDVALLSLANAAALAFFLLAPLWYWGDRLIFAVAYEASFDAAVRDVQAGGPLHGEVAGFSYSASPDRQFVAFRWLEGIPDGGTAVIYDAMNRLPGDEELSGDLSATILNLVNETPHFCWDFTGPYSKCHYD